MAKNKIMVDVLAGSAHVHTITVGAATVPASMMLVDSKYGAYAPRWHLPGGRSTTSKMTATAQAKRMNYLITKNKKGAKK